MIARRARLYTAVMHAPRLILGTLATTSLLTFAADALATKPVEIVAVMWKEDVSVKSEVEQFFGCLTKSSSFGGAWAAQFDLGPVTFKGVYVLNDPCPREAHQGGNLDQILAAAFDAGQLPKPSPNFSTSYVLYLPAGVQGYDQGGVPACQGTYCGVHTQTSYMGTDYDEALVPIQCADCGSVQVTLIGEHEAAEAIANMGSAQYEVGDGCEGPSNETHLQCCGTSYPIQQLAGPNGPNDCQTIDATGSMCGCAPSGDACARASDCCTGLACVAGKCATPAPDAGTGNDAGSDAGVADASADAGGSRTPDAAAPDDASMSGGGGDTDATTAPSPSSGGPHEAPGLGADSSSSGGCAINPSASEASDARTSLAALLLLVFGAASRRRRSRSTAA